MCLFWLGRMKRGNLGDTLRGFPKWTRGPRRSAPAGPLSPCGKTLVVAVTPVPMTEGIEEAAEIFGPFLITPDTIVQEPVAAATGRQVREVTQFIRNPIQRL